MACITSYTNTDFINTSCNLFPLASDTRLLEFRIRNCDGQEVTDCADSFNQTLCDADSEYYIPVSQQYIYFQMHFLDTLNTYPNPSTLGWQLGAGDDYLVKVELTNCCCEILEDQSTMFASIAASNVGRFLNANGSYTYFQNIKIDTTALPDIFSFVFTDNIGHVFWTKDCYRKVPCDNGATVIITSQQTTKYDCSGFIYATDTDQQFGSSFQMIRETEVFGDVYIDSYNLSKTLIRQTVLSSEINDKIKLNSDIISHTHAEEIKNILATNQIHLKGKDFDRAGLIYNGEMNKNQAKSRMWKLECELVSLSCLINYRCNII